MREAGFGKRMETKIGRREGLQICTPLGKELCFLYLSCQSLTSAWVEKRVTYHKETPAGPGQFSGEREAMRY